MTWYLWNWIVVFVADDWHVLYPYQILHFAYMGINPLPFPPSFDKSDNGGRGTRK